MLSVFGVMSSRLHFALFSIFGVSFRLIPGVILILPGVARFCEVPELFKHCYYWSVRRWVGSR